MAFADIETRWSRVFEAQQSQGHQPLLARNDLLVRYHDAVLQYLNRQLRDPHEAGKVYSDFAVRVFEIDNFLRKANPEKGRFRDYLQAVLRRMVVDHFRGRQRGAKHEQPLQEEHDPAASAEPAKDEEFLACWRQEIVNQTWKRLQTVEEREGKPYATLARLVEQQPALRSAQLAEEVSRQLGRPFTAAGVRQLRHRGRELFGKLLVEEVALSLKGRDDEKVTAERLEQELIDLGLLLKECKDALEEWSR